MRLRLIVLVLLVIAGTVGAFVLLRTDSKTDAWLILATVLALVAVTAALAVTTQRRRRATREVERYFTLSPEMVIFAGFDGYWKRVNPAVEAVLGYDEREALARPFVEFIHPDDRDRTDEEARRVVEGATAHGFENRILCKDGSYKWIEWTVTPVPQERVMYGVGRDVTERRRSESEQTALQRIARLVAEAEQPERLFEVVAEEVSRVVEVPIVSVARYEQDDFATLLASFSPQGPVFTVGRRLALEGTSMLRLARDRAGPARIDDYTGLPGEVAEGVRRVGIRSSAGAPIIVAGRVWGAIVASSYEQLPADVETRLADFTGLLATAIANAESHEALAELASEQAALRRVATLVARDAPSNEVFESVATEVGRLFDTEITIVGRYDDDGMATAIGNWSASPGGVPVGTRSAIGGRNLLSMVAETGKPARIDGYDDASGEAAEIARRHGWRSSIAAPIVVEGRLWGVMLVATQAPEPFPSGAEERLATFTDLIATAVANAQAHDELLRFGDEQAALGRVATLVAAGAAPEEVFTAVVQEASSLLGLERIELVRYDGDATGTVIAASGEHPFPTGSTWSLDDPSVMATVARTASAARIDDYRNLSGEIAAAARSAGFQSAIGAPITVEGRLWGVIIAISTDPEPIPERSEVRLGQFTDLVATAVANAEARHELESVATEQATLRRIATLVAQGVDPREVFAAVSEEVAATFAAIAAVLRFADDAPGVILAGASKEIDVPIGTHWDIDDALAAEGVFRTGRSVRVGREQWSAAGGPIGEVVRRLGIVSTVASPIVVEGSLWGVIGVNGREELPADTEQRLEKFTELVTTAISNAASRFAARRLADEQAALRRVATLVARGAPPEEIFAAAVNEVAGLLPVASATMGRFEPDDTVTTVASWSNAEVALPTGTRWPAEGKNVAWLVLQTRRSARVDDFSDATDPIGVAAREAGYTSAVGSPIVVEGDLWGVMTVASSEGQLPPGTESRLASFTELVATAIANAESQSALEKLADEQATLRRIATLVAQGLQPEEIFAVVIEEVGRLFGTDLTTVGRFDDDPPAFVAVALGNGMQGVDVGTRWALDDPVTAGRVFQSGHSVRVNERLRERSAALADMLARLGVASAVAGPIMVEGRLWGAVMVTSKEELAADTEGRLDKFAELVATAIANAESKSELAASRRRIVAASDDTRRQIERDLHDGTQQRLVSLGLAVRAAEAHLPLDRQDLREELSRVATGLADAVEDLQETSRGIHPAILSKGGLGPALQTLAHRSAIPVDLEIATDVRLPEPIEVAAYFVASEALANAAKHSQASRIDVSLEQRDGSLVLSIGDDGVGGANPGRGSGLIGLVDRVEALGGSISVRSREGNGTQVTAELPLELEFL